MKAINPMYVGIGIAALLGVYLVIEVSRKPYNWTYEEPNSATNMNARIAAEQQASRMVQHGNTYGFLGGN